LDDWFTKKMHESKQRPVWGNEGIKSNVGSLLVKGVGTDQVKTCHQRMGRNRTRSERKLCNIWADEPEESGRGYPEKHKDG